MSHAGRFDKTGLCGGPSHYLVKDAAFDVKMQRGQFDYRTLACKAPLLQGTKVVLLCGAPTLSIIGQPADRLNEIRGCPFTGEGGVVYIPTYHPQDAVDFKGYERTLNASVVEDGKEGEEGDSDDDDEDEGDVKAHGRTARRNYRFWFTKDLAKAVSVVRQGLRVNTATYNIGGDAEFYIKKLDSISGATVYFDIETDPRFCTLTCFGFSTDPHDIYVVPLAAPGSYADDRQASLHYSATDTARILHALARMFQRGNTLVLHNGLYDLFILAWRYKIPPPPQDMIRDTMIMHHRNFVDTEKSLGHCGSLYTHQPYHKDESKGVWLPRTLGEQRQLMTYNGKDVELTALVYLGLLSEAERDPLLAASFRHGNALVRPMLLKMLRGVPIDQQRLCALLDDANARTEFVETQVLPRLVGHSLNPRSSQQVGKYLYEELGIPSSLRNTAKRTLYKIALKYPLPVLKVIFAMRKMSKDRGVLRTRLWRDGNYTTCAYAIAGPKTLRLASRKLLGIYGTNLQNWEKRMRRLVVAPPGFKLIQVDQAGAEALIVAYMTRPGSNFRMMFEHRIKPHTYVAAHLFQPVWEAALGCSIAGLLALTLDKVRSHKLWKDLETLIKASDANPPETRYYYLAKQTCHSANYDVGEGEFVSNVLVKSGGQISIPSAEGKRFLDTYHGILPEVRGDFQSGVRKTLFRDRCVRNLFGFPLRFYGDVVHNDKLWKDAYARVPQSTVGCITCTADSALQRRIDRGELDIAILQNGHDSLLCMVREADVEPAIRAVQAEMNVEMTSPWGDKFRMRSEASVGDNWYEMEEVKL